MGAQGQEMMSRGAVYIISQTDRYLNLLSASVASLKRTMPQLHVTVFSQFPFDCHYVDNLVRIEASENGLYDKTRFMQQSPYEKTLFIDADIHIVEPIDGLFALLEQFDIAATHEEYRDTDWFHWYTRSDIPSSFPEFNTGILLFRKCPKVDSLLEQWRCLYEVFLKENPTKPLNDQPFFRAALYYSDARVATLTREYNCKFRGQGYLNGTVKVLHGHYKFEMSPPYIGKVIRLLNGSVRPRVYIAGRVFEQRIVGRVVGHRTAHQVGRFPEPPESLTLLRIHRLTTFAREQGMRKLVERTFGAVLNK